MSEKIATREAYGKALVELGEQNEKVVVLDADLAGATMTKYFKAAHPDRFFDCGIAEANMMNIGAGLSTMGLIPFCSTFAMFGAGRAYEQIRNSIAYPKFNVKICCSHAGVSVGEDGGSHQSVEDIGLMRLVPGMTVIVPADAKEARKAVFELAEFQGPAYMRLARLATPVFEEDYPFEIGKANVMREGKDAAVFACGLMVNEALEAAKLLAAEGVAEKCGNVVTVEEHSVIGGLGDAVADVLMGKVNCKFRKIGINDRFGQSGKAAEVLREYGLTADQIAERIKETL
ncbi:MAG: transketolase [Firmicutes bacterium CAG:176_63_11]|nr:MAG: transketolase [Firmicutes bacterium CAG:176_63_11]